MLLPAEAVAATDLIEVVRISALPAQRGVPYPGRAVAHWIGSEATDVLTLIENLPGSEQHRCGFSPGWSVRAYEDSLVWRCSRQRSVSAATRSACTERPCHPR